MKRSSRGTKKKKETRGQEKAGKQERKEDGYRIAFDMKCYL